VSRQITGPSSAFDPHRLQSDRIPLSSDRSPRSTHVTAEACSRDRPVTDRVGLRPVRRLAGSPPPGKLSTGWPDVLADGPVAPSNVNVVRWLIPMLLPVPGTIREKTPGESIMPFLACLPRSPPSGWRKRYPLVGYDRLFRFLFQYDVEVL
jgi:hypothetical protein